MRADLITVGDELLIGQVVNTNAAWLGEHLEAHGVEVVRTVTVGDHEARILDALNDARDADLVIVTGGLGPTHDDVTKKAVADFLGVEMEMHDEVLDVLRARFAARGQSMPERSHVMGLVPRGMELLTNQVGTAPGLWFDGPPRLVVLPGVPREMKALVEQHVLPRLDSLPERSAIVHRTLLTAGAGESTLAEKIGDLSSVLGDGLLLAFLPSTHGVRLRLSARGAHADTMHARLDRAEQFLRRKIGRYIYGEGQSSLEEVVGARLAERGLTVAVAESCTGGHVLNRLTNVPGSSRYVKGGLVAYGNDIKEHQAGVTSEALAAHGAVSREVAEQLAAGIRDRLHADIGLSTTGVAGPGGGTPEKPVGLVWVGYADAHTTFALELRLTKDRLLNKELSATAVLDLLRRQLDGPLIRA